MVKNYLNISELSIRLNLIGGKRLYKVDRFVAGVALEIPGNTILTPNNYYALMIKYVDTDVSVYGANTSYSTNYYNNGQIMSVIIFG